MAVVFGHIGPLFGLSMISGSLAVQCFFIISGFYMSLILGTRYPITRAGIKKFYLNRYLRLAPAYWVMILLCVWQAYQFGQIYAGLPVETVSQLLRQLPLVDSIWILFTNVFLVGVDATMFQAIVAPGALEWTSDYNSGVLAAHKLLLIPPAWSLGIELWFYILAPFLAVRSSRWLLGGLLLSLTIRLALYWGGLYEDPWGYRFFPSELAFFLAGMLMHRLYRRLGEKIKPSHGLASIFLLIAGLFVLPAITVSETAKHSLFLIFFAASIPFSFHASRFNTWDRWIGELSYPIYICHTFNQQLVMTLGRSLEVSSQRVVIVGTTLLLAIVLKLMVELPLEKFRRAPSRA